MEAYINCNITQYLKITFHIVEAAASNMKQNLDSGDAMTYLNNLIYNGSSSDGAFLDALLNDDSATNKHNTDVPAQMEVSQINLDGPSKPKIIRLDMNQKTLLQETKIKVVNIL